MGDEALRDHSYDIAKGLGILVVFDHTGMMVAIRFGVNERLAPQTNRGLRSSRCFRENILQNNQLSCF